MFDLIKQNILKRYSVQKLSEMYGVNLSNAQDISEKIKNIDKNKLEVIKSNYYDVLNKNKFVKSGGEKADVRVDNNEKVILINSRIGFFQKILALLMSFFNGIIDKIMNFFNGMFNNFISKLPVELVNIASGVFIFSLNLILIPFTLLKVILSSIALAKKHMLGGGVLGIIIGIIVGITMLIFQIILLCLSIILSPIIDKIVDSMIMRNSIKRMIIGHFVIDNNYDGTIVITSNMVSNISFEKKSNLLGKEKLYVIIKEGNEDVTLIDRIKALIVPNYFVNKQSVIVTDVENQEKFENIFKS